MENGYYSKTIDGFLHDSEQEILGGLSQNNQFSLEITQRNSWKDQIPFLKRILEPYPDGRIIFEYTIPRLGKRIDVVLLIKEIVFILEFKVGASEYVATDETQAWNYAVELNCFHEASRGRLLVPILVATNAPIADNNSYEKDEHNMLPLICANTNTLEDIIKIVLEKHPQRPTTPDWTKKWENSRYLPSPTIIEATTALFSNHKVAEIANCESKENLTTTSNYILRIIEEAKSDPNGRKAIIFVTGVPGAGKTLVGLNIASAQHSVGDHAVFLSGNGPLVNILRDALVKDRVARYKVADKKALGEAKASDDSHKVEQAKENATKHKTEYVENEVKPLIQIVHNYRDTMLKKLEREIVDGVLKIDKDKVNINSETGAAEVEHVAIFDEAQRAWKREDLCKFLSKRYDFADKFPYSEPAFLIWSMDQQPKWAVIVCLVGGGQEINHGEAGILEWIEAVKNHFPHWHVYLSNELKGREYNGENLEVMLKELDPLRVHNGEKEEALHLKTSIRSIRTDKVAQLVEAILSRDVEVAKSIYVEVHKRYPLYITRSLDNAKRWLAEKGNMLKVSLVSDAKEKNPRVGLLVSSRGGRVKALGHEILKENSEPKGWYIDWFLSDPKDVRSSNFLEIVGNEFIVQGLELDYVGMIWESDFRYSEAGWEQFAWRGGRWNAIDKDCPFDKSEEKRRQYNAYRVLLTRARQGMVIVVPEGSTSDDIIPDDTRKREYYDSTYKFLKSIGIKELPIESLDAKK